MVRDLGLPTLLGVLAAALIAVGVAVGEPDVQIEGAYFNRAVGKAEDAAVFSKVGPGLLSPSDGNLWLGAGIGLALAALGAAAGSRRKRPT